jgi:hypothetical protein
MKTLTGDSGNAGDAVSFPEDGVDLRRADSLEPGVQALLDKITLAREELDALAAALSFSGANVAVLGGLAVVGDIAGDQAWSTLAGTDADTTLNAGSSNVIYVATLTATRTYTLPAAPDTSGKWHLFVNADAGSILGVSVTGGGGFGSTSVDPLAFLLVCYVAGSWKILFRGATGL